MNNMKQDKIKIINEYIKVNEDNERELKEKDNKSNKQCEIISETKNDRI